MKIPPSIGDDAFLPMFEEDISKVVDIKQKRNQHWARLRLARLDSPNSDHFIKWLETQHGIQIHMTNDMISDSYAVVDQAKYTMYLLKYGR